jgi:hypothetical protein
MMLAVRAACSQVTVVEVPGHDAAGWNCHWRAAVRLPLEPPSMLLLLVLFLVSLTKARQVSILSAAGSDHGCLWADPPAAKLRATSPTSPTDIRHKADAATICCACCCLQRVIKHCQQGIAVSCRRQPGCRQHLKLSLPECVLLLLLLLPRLSWVTLLPQLVLCHFADSLGRDQAPAWW